MHNILSIGRASMFVMPCFTHEIPHPLNTHCKTHILLSCCFNLFNTPPILCATVCMSFILPGHVHMKPVMHLELLLQEAGEFCLLWVQLCAVHIAVKFISTQKPMGPLWKDFANRNVAAILVFKLYLCQLVVRFLVLPTFCHICWRRCWPLIQSNPPLL
jgi:hypothetical protein